ncbi:MAG: hypothetical protein OEW15_04880 [Nitrospirota bacterium]|nr:hypothetical protein [Nitrospirota bacterium]
MELTKPRAQEKKVRDKIIAALREYRPQDDIAFSKFTNDRIPDEFYHKEITKAGIEQGLECLRLINNMSGLSAGDFDLLTLLEHYILNLDSRDAINKVLNARRGR